MDEDDQDDEGYGNVNDQKEEVDAEQNEDEVMMVREE